MSREALRERGWAVAAAVAVLAYLPAAFLPDLFHDDRALVASNFLLHDGWRGLWGLWTSGQWEPVKGAEATVHYYRPFLMTTFWLQAMTTGDFAQALRAVNVALHAGVAALLWHALRTRLPAPAATAAAALYAASPLHAEAVAAVVNRSEVLAAILLLASWRLLGGPGRPSRWGFVLFGAALTTKESAFLFPPLLALSDWVFHGRVFWGRERRRVYAVLAASAAAVVAARLAVLPTVVSGGVPYFDSRLTAALTFAKFAAARYLLVALTGVGQCSDFSRPLVPDSSAGDLAALLCLGGWLALLAAGVRLSRARRPAGFVILASTALLAPTSHLLLPLNSIGAERFLYLPLAGLAAGFGAAYERLGARWRRGAPVLAAVLTAWFGTRALARVRTYRSGRAFFEAATACNPGSAMAWSSLGATLLREGDLAGGERLARKAMALDPGLPTPRVNLAHLAYDRGDAEAAERLVVSALERGRFVGEAWVLGGLIAERLGRLDIMRERLERAASLRPDDALAWYNLGRYWLMAGRPDRGEECFRRYLDRVPEDREIAGLVAGLAESGADTDDLVPLDKRISGK